MVGFRKRNEVGFRRRVREIRLVLGRERRFCLGNEVRKEAAFLAAKYGK